MWGDDDAPPSAALGSPATQTDFETDPTASGLDPFTRAGIPAVGSCAVTQHDHPNVEKVAAALSEAGIRGEIRILPDAARTAVAAAEALGIEVGQIANSLVFSADGGPLLIMASGAHRVDTRKVALAHGYTSIKRADPAFVTAHSGQTIGGVAPTGHPSPLRTLVDTALAQYDEIWAAGGIAHAVFPLTYEELVRLTNGTPADVA